jgi:dihydrofolate reductase
VYSRSETFQDTDTVKRISGEPEDIISELKAEYPDKNIIIAGGLNVFEKFYDLIDEWRVTIVDEFVVYDKQINLTNIQYTWPKHQLISTGQDLNQNFNTFNYSK